MGKPPAFQFYPDSWLSSSDIMLMTPAEEGAYIRLLAIAWLSDDCGLPDDDEALALLSRLGEGWLKGGSTVVRKKFEKRDGRLYNFRLLEERKKQEEWREKSREGGKKSANIRWGKKKTGNKGGYKLVTKCLQPNCNPSSPSSSPSFRGTKVPLAKRKASPSPDVKIFIDWWFDRFLRHTGNPYVVSGAKDGQTVKRLLGTYPIDRLKDLGEKFFTSEDAFIQSAGYTIGVFSTQVNKIACPLKSISKTKTIGPDDPEWEIGSGPNHPNPNRRAW